MNLEPGQIVLLRSRQYLVEDVAPPERSGEDTLVRLSCLPDDAQGKEVEVFWEREVDARVLGATSWEAVTKKGFDDPKLFSAYVYSLRWNCVTSTRPELFQAPLPPTASPGPLPPPEYPLKPLRTPPSPPPGFRLHGRR